MVAAGINATLTFVIDLACLASRREYLKLDKWMSDNLTLNLETFMPICVQFLMSKVRSMSGIQISLHMTLLCTVTQDRIEDSRSVRSVPPQVPYLSNPANEGSGQLITQECVHTILATMMSQVKAVSPQHPTVTVNDPYT